MTPEEIADSRKHIQRVSAVELSDLYVKGPGGFPADAWRIIEEEVARRERVKRMSDLSRSGAPGRDAQEPNSDGKRHPHAVDQGRWWAMMRMGAGVGGLVVLTIMIYLLAEGSENQRNGLVGASLFILMGFFGAFAFKARQGKPFTKTTAILGTILGMEGAGAAGVLFAGGGVGDVAGMAGEMLVYAAGSSVGVILLLAAVGVTFDNRGQSR